MEKQKFGLNIVSIDDESGIPFGMHEGVIITCSHPIMEATIFKMIINNNLYYQDEHFSVSNDAIIRHSSCSADLVNFLTTLAMQYYDVNYEDLALTDDLVRCCDLLDSNLLYERKEYNKQLNNKRKIIDFTKK